MPKKGDVCESCQTRWEERNREPKILVSASGKTEVKGEFVLLCPYCDGDAVEVTKLKNHELPS